MIVEIGELYWVDFPFEEEQKSKIRPAIIVLKETKGKIACVKITTSCWRKAKNDFIIIDWKQAGLTEESLAEMKRIETIEVTKVKEKIGRLSNKDKKRLLRAMEGVGK